ncbi:MAG: hypothetical protein ACOX7P_01725 [Oscillospiraceae bacterium]|jgi:hypothetical protein
MITAESIASIDKNDLEKASGELRREDISQLVDWLTLKDDTVRYQSFLLLQYRSRRFDDVYPYWDVFADKLKNENSYQRTIGLVLMAENAKWDKAGKLDKCLDTYLELIYDAKPITARQCIQSLEKIAAVKPDLTGKIAENLISFDLMSVRDSMRKLILIDILNVLIAIRKEHSLDGIDSFVLSALSGDILDNKAKKQFKSLIGV